MDKQMIEEMAKIMCGGCIENELMTCIFTKEEIPCDFAKNFAEAIYNAGYRKIPEGAVVLTREAYNRLFTKARQSEIKTIDLESIVNARKEMAEKFAEKVNQAINSHKKAVGMGDYVVDAERMIFENNQILKEITEGEDAKND